MRGDGSDGPSKPGNASAEKSQLLLASNWKPVCDGRPPATTARATLDQIQMLEPTLSCKSIDNHVYLIETC